MLKKGEILCQNTRQITQIYPNWFPESLFPFTSGRKTRVLGATISGMRHRCRLRSETGWAESPEFGYFKMVAPRALVFRPLVKGNEDSGNEIEIYLKREHRMTGNPHKIPWQKKYIWIFALTEWDRNPKSPHINVTSVTVLINLFPNENSI